jgi:hypothetical protein
MTTTATSKGGAGKCTICAHPQRDAIDAALISGSVSRPRVAAEFGVNESSLRRHQANHPARSLVKLTMAEPTIHDAGTRIDVPAQLRDQHSRALAAVRAAEKSGSMNAIQGAHREYRLTLDSIAKWNNEQAKLELMRRPPTTINLLTTPSYRKLREVVFDQLTTHDLKHHAGGYDEASGGIRIPFSNELDRLEKEMRHEPADA